MATHYTKDEIVTRDFLFISYKHEDKPIVSEVIDFLYEAGVRFWYDTDLTIGERWTEVAEKLIKDEHCRGVIFFNSTASFVSEPVYKERLFTLERMEVCKKKGLPFFVFPVNIGKPSTARLIKEVLGALPDDDREIEKIFPLKYIQGISELFNSETIYCYADPQNKDAYTARLYENIAKALPTVIDKDALRMKELEQGTTETAITVRFGICREDSAHSLPPYLLQENRVVTLQNNTYIVQNGKAYGTKRITWRPLYCENDTFVLLSEETVDLRGGGSELSAWLAGEFSALAFTPEEREQIGAIRLLTMQDIQKTQNAAQLVFPPTPENPDGHWWIGDMAHGALQKTVKKDGKVNAQGYNIRTKRSGVRPVITLSREVLMRLTGKS